LRQPNGALKNRKKKIKTFYETNVLVWKRILSSMTVKNIKITEINNRDLLNNF